MSKVDKILNNIAYYKKELEKLQDKCRHPKKEVRFINSKEGVRWVCDECKKALGWPTPDELKKWSSK